MAEKTFFYLAIFAARVNSLHTKLQLALQEIKRGDLEPMHAKIQPQDLSTSVVFGVSQGSGEYFSRIGVGTSAKLFYMVLDTGSDVNWLQCGPCSDCYQQSDSVFNPARSSSSTPSSSPCAGDSRLISCAGDSRLIS